MAAAAPARMPFHFEVVDKESRLRGRGFGHFCRCSLLQREKENERGAALTKSNQEEFPFIGSHLAEYLRLLTDDKEEEREREEEGPLHLLLIVEFQTC